MVGNPSLPAATKQEADEQSDSRGDTYCLPRLFAHIAVSKLGRITDAIGDRSRHLFDECPCRRDAGMNVRFGTGQIVAGQRGACFDQVFDIRDEILKLLSSA